MGSPGYLIEAYILLVIAFVLLLLRVYTRLYASKPWAWDDNFIVVAFLFLIAQAVLLHLMVNNGLGKHISDIPNSIQSTANIMKFNIFFEMVNILSTLFTKISIGFYILRIKSDRRLRLTLFILVVLMGLATLQSTVVLLVTCRPLKKVWEIDTPGTCLSPAQVYATSYVQSAFTIICDFYLTAIPIIILWNVKIQRGRKTLICFLMSLGLVATISNILRNAFIPLLTGPDFTARAGPAYIVAVLESSAGIIAACIPACVPIIKHWRKSNKPPTRDSLPLDGKASADIRAAKRINVTTITTIESARHHQGDNESTDRILGGSGDYQWRSNAS